MKKPPSTLHLLPKPTHDWRTLRARVDLRELVARFWGPPDRKSSRYCQYFAHWRDDGGKPSFTVYADGYVDYGGSGDRGDVFGFLMRELGLDFPQAASWLEQDLGLTASHHDTKEAQRRPSLPLPVYGEGVGGWGLHAEVTPPPADWQAAARHLIETAQANLWSDTYDARRIRHYLYKVRGLTDDTLRAAGLGYNPQWTMLDWINPANHKAPHLPPGIIQPWINDGVVWAVRVRCRVGNLAKTLGILDDGIHGDPLDKYLNLTGSKQSGALYNADSLVPGGDVLIVEGEFDALLASQIFNRPPGSLLQPDTLEDGRGGSQTLPYKEIANLEIGQIAVVTLGSASSRPAPRRLKQLQSAGRIFLLMDADAAGQTAAHKLIAALQTTGHPPEIYRLTLPVGKDVTEFVVTHGGDVQALFASQTFIPNPSPGNSAGEQNDTLHLLPLPVHGEGVGGWGLSDALRSALLTYFRHTTAPVMELFFHAIRERWLNPDHFTLRDLSNANERAGYGLAQATLYRVMNDLNGYFFSEVEAVNPPNTTPTNEKKGRRATYYRLLPLTTIKQAILAFAAPRLIERYYPAEGETPILAEITPALLLAVGYGERETVDVMAALHQRLQHLYVEQGESGQRAQKAVWRAMRQLQAALDNPHSTPLPEGEALPNGAAYRAAFLRATNHSDERRSRKAMRDLVGVVDSGLGKVIQRANLRPAVEGGEFEVVALHSADDLERQVQRSAYEVRGYPKHIVVQHSERKAEQTVYLGRESQAYVASALASGAEVVVRYQVANRYVVSEQAETPPETRPIFTRPKKPTTAEAAPKRKRPAHIGTTHDPQWAYDQLRLALLKLKGAAYEWYGDDLIDQTTGEVWERPSARHLIALLLDGELPDELTDVTYRPPIDETLAITDLVAFACQTLGAIKQAPS